MYNNKAELYAGSNETHFYAAGPEYANVAPQMDDNYMAHDRFKFSHAHGHHAMEFQHQASGHISQPHPLEMMEDMGLLRAQSHMLPQPHHNQIQY